MGTASAQNGVVNGNYGSAISNSNGHSNGNSNSNGSNSSSDSHSPSTAKIVTSNTIQCFSNGFKSIVGSGICAMPFAFRCSGWLVGLLVLISVCIASAASMHQLVLCVQTIRKQQRQAAGIATEWDVNDLDERENEATIGFRQLGELCIPGRFGRMLVNCSLLGCQLGGNCAFVAFIASSLFSVLEVHELSHIVSHTMVVILLFPFLTMLSMSKSTAYLSNFSHFGNIALFVSVATVLAYSATQTEQGITFASLAAMEAYTDLQGAAICIGVMAFSVCAHAEMMAIETDAADRLNFRSVITGVLVLITVAYAAFALPVYAALGAETNGNVMLNMKSKGFVDVVKIFMSLSVLVMFPLSLIPAVRAMDEMFSIDSNSSYHNSGSSSHALDKLYPEAEEATTLLTQNGSTHIDVNSSSNSSSHAFEPIHDDRNERLAVLLRVTTVTATCLVTILVDNYALIVALVGSIAGGSLSFVLPGLFYTILHWRELTVTQTVLLAVQLAFGIGLIGVGLFVALL